VEGHSVSILGRVELQWWQVSKSLCREVYCSPAWFGNDCNYRLSHWAL